MNAPPHRRTFSPQCLGLTSSTTGKPQPFPPPGALGWSYTSDDRLAVTFGGKPVTP